MPSACLLPRSKYHVATLKSTFPVELLLAFVSASLRVGVVAVLLSLSCCLSLGLLTFDNRSSDAENSDAKGPLVFEY